MFGSSVCQGGCYAVNWDMTGDLHKAPKSECDYNKIQHNAGVKYKKLMDDAGLGLERKKIHDACFCYNMCYTEGPGKEEEMKKRFLTLSKRILETHGLEKTPEQIKLEQDILDKTIKML